MAIDQLFSSDNIIFINGAVLGSSRGIENDAVIILSGQYRKIVIELLEESFNIKDAGEKTESASAYKLLFSLVHKGINTVFFEAMAGAARYGIIDELNNSLKLYLPGTYQDLIKTTPTYIDHISRRMHEMEGLAETQQNEGLPNNITAAAKTFEMVKSNEIFKGPEPSNVLETFQLFKNFKMNPKTDF